MAQPADDKTDSTRTDREGKSRRTRRRQRSVLNLGVPFVQLDEFLNQSEDAVALGYRVLEETIEEIKAGYQQAKNFNEAQRAFEEGTSSTPPNVPWADLVKRVQNLQNIAFRTVRTGNEIFFDSLKSGTNAMAAAAKTFEQSDDSGKPRMAGPVFNEVLPMRVVAGQQLAPRTWSITHRGLARLRINAELKPELKQLDNAHSGSKVELATLKGVSVSFAPDPEKPEEVSNLVVDLGRVPKEQPPGEYEGVIKATNFELLIAKLRVTVDHAAPYSGTPARRSRRARKTVNSKRRK